MPAEMQEKIVRLGDRMSSAKLNLTPDEYVLISKSHPTGIPDARPLEYDAATRIVSYNCGNCHGEHKSMPRIEIFIRQEPFIHSPYIGEAAMYCGTCDNMIHTAHVKPDDPIVLKDVKRDESGKVIIPTPQAIESELEKALKQASENTGSSLYERSISVAETWAKRINYALAPERLASIREMGEKAYITDYQNSLKETLTEMLKRGSWSLDDCEGMSHYEASGLCETFSEFYEILPKLTVTDKETQGLVCCVLKNYESMVNRKLESDRDELKKMEATVAGSVKEAAEATKSIEELLKKHAIPKEFYDKADAGELVNNIDEF